MHDTPSEQVCALRTYAGQPDQNRHKVDTAAPSLLTRTLADDTLTLTYSEPLNTTAPAPTAIASRSTVRPSR